MKKTLKATRYHGPKGILGPPKPCLWAQNPISAQLEPSVQLQWCHKIPVSNPASGPIPFCSWLDSLDRPRQGSCPHHVWGCQRSLLVCLPGSVLTGTAPSRGEPCPHWVTLCFQLIPMCGAASLTLISHKNFQFLLLWTTSSWKNNREVGSEPFRTSMQRPRYLWLLPQGFILPFNKTFFGPKWASVFIEQVF